MRSGFKRNEIFITTKIWQTICERRISSARSIRSRKKLQLPVIGLVLIHLPNPSLAYRKEMKST